MYNSNGREKNPADRVRRNPETYVIDYVEWDGKMHGPPLPKAYEWCQATKDWWATWRHSPQSMVMTDTDWDFMLDTAILHNMLWSPVPEVDDDNPNRRRTNGAVSVTQLAGEIRQRVSKFGVTYEDRKKLRMSVDTPQTSMDSERAIDADAEVLVDYVEMLNKNVAEKQKGKNGPS